MYSQKEKENFLIWNLNDQIILISNKYKISSNISNIFVKNVLFTFLFSIIMTDFQKCLWLIKPLNYSCLSPFGLQKQNIVDQVIYK